MFPVLMFSVLMFPVLCADEDVIVNKPFADAILVKKRTFSIDVYPSSCYMLAVAAQDDSLKLKEMPGGAAIEVA